MDIRHVVVVAATMSCWFDLERDKSITNMEARGELLNIIGPAGYPTRSRDNRATCGAMLKHCVFNYSHPPSAMKFFLQ